MSDQQPHTDHNGLVDPATLRAEDWLYTGGQWETVTVDAFIAEDVVTVRTRRSGEARTRTFAPGEQVTARRADLRHPYWCDPAECQAGTDDLDPYHRTAVRRVEAARPGEPTITAQVWQTVHEPIETGPASLVLTFDASFVLPDVRAYDLEPRQVAALHAQLGKVAAILAARAGGGAA